MEKSEIFKTMKRQLLNRACMMALSFIQRYIYKHMSFFAGVKRKQNSGEETASHPSWEASKRRKLQQNISQTKFQGQKITFDDSD